MKKVSLIMISFVFALTGCASTASEGDAVPASLSSFSYEEDYMLYYDDFGVRTSDFLNTDICLVDDQESAVERAKNECTIEYNAISEYYDSEAEMWRVDFQTISKEQGIAILVGPRQSVYLDNDGITHLIVFHELGAESAELPDNPISQTEAKEIALAAHKVKYNYIETEFDATQNTWIIGFWEDNAVIASQTIVVDAAGNISSSWFAE